MRMQTGDVDLIDEYCSNQRTVEFAQNLTSENSKDRRIA